MEEEKEEIFVWECDPDSDMENNVYKLSEYYDSVEQFFKEHNLELKDDGFYWDDSTRYMFIKGKKLSIVEKEKIITREFK